MILSHWIILDSENPTWIHFGSGNIFRGFSVLGYKSIAEEMKDACLKKLVEKIGYEEGMPVVVNPGFNEMISGTGAVRVPLRKYLDC